MTATLDDTDDTDGTLARLARLVADAGVVAADTVSAPLARMGLSSARALGATSDEIRAYTTASPFLRDGRFHNLQTTGVDVEADFQVVVDMLRRPGRPRRSIPVLRPNFPAEARSVSATWLGHASVLVELDGVRVLTDPVFSDRCSPSQLIGPRRLHPSPVAVTDLPPIDIVLISHDHYDHLDMATIVELAQHHPNARFVVPLGVAAHLITWGVVADRIEQADWWDELTVRAGATSLTFTCCPARHFSGRSLARDVTQWASWVVGGSTHRMFFSGDTGFAEHFDEVGSRFGPVDLTLLAVGAYDPLWPDVHLTPEEAVAVHRMLTRHHHRDAVLLPIHWGTFDLARHAWADPIVRLLSAASAAGVTVLVPPPGGGVDAVSRAGSGLGNPGWWEGCV